MVHNSPAGRGGRREGNAAGTPGVTRQERLGESGGQFAL